MTSVLSCNSPLYLIRRCEYIPIGETNTRFKVVIRGLVRSRKSDLGTIPLLFRLTTDQEPEYSILVRWNGNERNTPRHDSFDRINERLEEGCTVEVVGFLRRTRNGKPMLNAVTVSLVAYPQNSECLEETWEMDKEYVSDTDSDDDYVPETDSEPEDMEEESKVSVPPLPRKVRINSDLTLMEDRLIFHKAPFEIIAFRTKPGRVTIKTSLGNFHFDRMDNQLTSVLVPATVFEPSLPGGYAVLVRTPFRKILECLF